MLRKRSGTWAEPGPSRPILVAVSGYAQPEDVARGKEAGFDAHLAKPLGIDVLTRLLTDTPTTSTRCVPGAP